MSESKHTPERWTSARKRASEAFARYIAYFRGYTNEQKQTAEAAFFSGFRSGVLFVEGKYRDLVRASKPPCNCKDVGGACSDCYDGPMTDVQS
jgi:hypothetical protein